MIIHVPLDQIDDNPFQRRQDYGDVESLAADIAARGLLQRPVGRLVHDHGEPVVNYDLVLALDNIRAHGFPAGLRVQLAFGHRRLRAYRHLFGNPDIDDSDEFGALPVEVVPYTDDGMLDAVWSENQHRSDINAIEQAELLAEKLERARAAGGNQSTVAAEWKLDRSTVANKLRLLELPADVQAAVRERRLSERQALALLPVMELEKKLNGADVKWRDAGGESWHPTSPAGFVAAMLKEPEVAISDRIREYTREAERHAGEPLPEAFAKFEAGQGPEIIQSACKGCAHRHNRTCLRPACFGARYRQLLAALPELAAAAMEETGLPYSEDADDFPGGWADLDAIETAWESETRDGLVWGINLGEARVRPFHDRRYAGDSDVREDWRRAICIGRRQPAVEEESDPRNLPDEADLARWRKAQAKADKERQKRVREFLHSQMAGMMNDTVLRTLATMLAGRELKEFEERMESPTAEQLLDLIFDHSWSIANTYAYGTESATRDALAVLLRRAGWSEAIVDPPDPALRLLDIGQLALLYWDGASRYTWGKDSYRRQTVKRLSEAIAEFDRQPADVYGSDELQRLLEYLREALAAEGEKLNAQEETNE